MPSFRRRCAGAAVVLLLGFACSGGEPAAPTKPKLAYVSLGDSYSAGGGLAGGTRPCGRAPGAYPALVQSLKVRPSAKTLEAEYIGRNITATSAAFGLDRVERIQNPAPPAHMQPAINARIPASPFGRRTMPV